MLSNLLNETNSTKSQTNINIHQTTNRQQSNTKTHDCGLVKGKTK